MAEITYERTGKFLRKICEYLINNPEGLQPKEILENIQHDFELSDYEKGYYPSSPDSPRYHKIIRFATIDLVKAGWLLKRNNRIWLITNDGKEAYEKFTDPEKFYREAVHLYNEWNKKRTQEDEIESLESDSPQESIDITFEEAQEKAWEQVKSHIRTLNAYEFQDLVADLLKAMGYFISWVAPRGPDCGIDIIAFNDPLGTKSPRIKVQVKHHADQTMSISDIREFLSVLGNNEVGIYVSSGGFTRDAEEHARTQETRKITLIDLDKLFNLWIEYYDKLDFSARERLPIKAVYYLAPEE